MKTIRHLAFLVALLLGGGGVARLHAQATPNDLVEQGLAALLREHAGDLGTFLTTDPMGRRVPELVESLAHGAAEEQARLLQEIDALQQNIDHIKDIVAMQQS